MKVRIKQISPPSLAAAMAAIYFVIGSLIGMLGVMASASGSEFTMGGPISFSGSGTGMLWFAIAYPFLASLVGAISGFLIAWVYNFSAEFTGGIVVETETLDRSQFL